MNNLVAILSNLKYFEWILLVVFLMVLIRKPTLKYFRIFMMLVVMFELLLANILEYKFQNNTPVYSIYYIICVAYYLFLFGHHHFKGKSKRSIFFVIMPVWIIISLINFFFVEGVMALNRYSYIAGALINIGVVNSYYFSILKGDVTDSLLKQPLFILSVGILLLYACGFPIIFHLDSLLVLDTAISMYIFDFLLLGNFFLSLSYLYISLWPTIMKKYYIN